ncbi:hypothetical protein D8Y22_05445 [Salinadaptatus halalkaliphilus]|uniref:Uncharacterized protein n=1 Tax=Salinadaptatus halalkaliphilus TaxID=2419781 RepID=A0A4S3TNE3_9EURY|nr:hypothetical protein [Salinadaptatus halalkaliphilus]THE65829.1 hypothetical protein D8Y22_05445 [Salinadaptatus halalkaliphilus]
MSSNPQTVQQSSTDNPEPVVATFKSKDDVVGRRPDHDPHGESQALAAHCTTSCDSCGITGLVPEETLIYADGLCRDGPEKDIICPDCDE